MGRFPSVEDRVTLGSFTLGDAPQEQPRTGSRKGGRRWRPDRAGVHPPVRAGRRGRMQVGVVTLRFDPVLEAFDDSPFLRQERGHTILCSGGLRFSQWLREAPVLLQGVDPDPPRPGIKVLASGD